jgi:succinate dehydrogenase / fumarate reductase iron-sulfur subunit
VTPKGALAPHKIPKDDRQAVQAIFDTVHGREDRVELNLYVSGYEDVEDPTGAADADEDAASTSSGQASAPGPDPHKESA